jgi:putative sterol carrier protein/uncharacterized OB-fold protein
MTKKPDPSSGVTVAHIFSTMEQRVNPKGVAGVEANYGYVITGEGGGEWTVSVHDDAVKVREGLHDPDVTTTVSAQDWIDITLGKLDGMTAFTTGRLKASGEMGLLMKAPKFFKKYEPPRANSGAPEVSVAHIFSTMEQRVNPKGVAGVEANYGYVITGEGGGEWTVSVHDNAVKIREGLHDPDVTTTASAQDFIDINIGKLDGMTAFTTGRLKVTGEPKLLMKAPKLFKKYVPPSAEPQERREELIVQRQTLSVPQRFATGPLFGKFLAELRDNRRIIGNKCPRCGRTQSPPREICAVCRIRVDDLVELGPAGEVANFDIVYYASPDPLTGETRETPYCAVFLRLDGCRGDDVFWHELNPADIPRVRKGIRVRPVFAEKRTGAITDIEYFTIIE